MRVLTKNTAGLNQLYKLHQTLRLAWRHNVTFCQETKLKIDQMSMIRSKWGSKDVFMSTANTARRGVLTSPRSPRLGAKILHEISDNGQFHILVTNIKSEIYMLVNVYGSPDGDTEAG